MLGLHGLMVMTREWGGDDRKLFPSSQSVNYSFPLIRLWSQLPPPRESPPSNHSISQSEILSELIPGNVYFEEQIVALLLTQCVNVEVGIGTDNPMYDVSYCICQRATCVCHVAFPVPRGKVGISSKSVRFLLWGWWMCVQNFMVIHPIVVGISVWTNMVNRPTDRQTLPYRTVAKTTEIQKLK